MATNIQQITNLLNSKIDHIKKWKSERFKDKWLVDIILNDNMLNIEVGESINVNIGNKINQHVLDFYKDQRIFVNFSDFENFFNELLNGHIEKSKGIYATYQGEQYLCDIELTSVDPDRQMGPENLYELTFADENGETINAADISEYPMGSFSIYETNDEVEIDEIEVINYFMDQTMD